MALGLKARRRRERVRSCHCCKDDYEFCWNCRCGFSICQSCMDENRWGMTCNNITWVCPDCGDSNNYGNQ